MKDLRTLLQKTSRTFSLSIPVLPEPTNHEERGRSRCLEVPYRAIVGKAGAQGGEG